MGLLVCALPSAGLLEPLGWVLWPQTMVSAACQVDERGLVSIVPANAVTGELSPFGTLDLTYIPRRPSSLFTSEISFLLSGIGLEPDAELLCDPPDRDVTGRGAGVSTSLLEAARGREMNDFSPHAISYDASVMSEEEVWKLIRASQKHPDDVVVLFISSGGWVNDKEPAKE